MNLPSKKIDRNPTLSIIIVNWNGRRYLESCLGSLKELFYPKNKIKIILVDNGSTDDSITWTNQNFPSVRILQNKTNLGFAKANNIGIIEALKDPNIKYLITLNNDTEVDKNWLKNLVNFMEKNKTVGIAVGKMLQNYHRDMIDSAGDFFSRNTYRVVNRGSNEKDIGQYNLAMEVLSACAAASIFRRKTLEEVRVDNEFFDEDFISYIEDVDLNIRARLKNWMCFYVPDAIVYHVGSGTSSKVSKGYKEYLSRRNRILFAIKNFPARYAFILILRYIIPTYKGLVFYLIKRIESRPKKSLTHYLGKTPLYFRQTVSYLSSNSDLSIIEVFLIQISALYGALKLLPRILRKRTVIQKGRKIKKAKIKSWFDKLAISQ